MGKASQHGRQISSNSPALSQYNDWPQHFLGFNFCIISDHHCLLSPSHFVVNLAQENLKNPLVPRSGFKPFFDFARYSIQDFTSLNYPFLFSYRISTSIWKKMAEFLQIYHDIMISPTFIKHEIINPQRIRGMSWFWGVRSREHINNLNYTLFNLKLYRLETSSRTQTCRI